VTRTLLLPALVGFGAVLAVTFGVPSHGIDVAVTRWLQTAAPAPDVPAAALVFLINAEVLIPLVAIAGLVLWPRDRLSATAAWRLAAGLIVVSGIAFTLKWLLPHPGPPSLFQRPVFRPGVSVPQPYSFPSGHTMRTTYFAAVALRRHPGVAALLILAVMASLVYLGDHWVTDVAGGLCLGLACAETARLLLQRN
jgi:membrane-associated phospholipid phosphatase